LIGGEKMQKLKYSYKTRIDFAGDIFRHYFSLRIMPRKTPFQNLLESNVEILPPEANFNIQTDGLGNRVQVGEYIEPHDWFEYTATGVAEIDLMKREKEHLHPIYLHPTKQTTPGAGIIEFFNHRKPEDADTIVNQALYYCWIVYNHFAYTPLSTTVSTTAEEAFVLAKGVCQDYSQVMIALCRLRGIAARYVSGIQIGEGASHAWVEVYDEDGYWIGIDPTNNCMVDETYIVLGIGRDAQDCLVEKGVFYGQGGQTQTVTVKVEKIE
jgi:transglutaminase-like putative cysteine protease